MRYKSTPVFVDQTQDNRCVGFFRRVTQGSNELSDEIKDHHFEPFAGGKGQFASLGGSQSAAPVKKKKKTKPNEPVS